MPDQRLEKTIYIMVKINYKDMAEALETAKAKMGIRENTRLIRQLIWNKAKGIQ